MKTIAIIVGISTYKDSAFDTISGAQADAKRFASALMSWGLPKESIYFISNEKATKSNIIKTFYDCRSVFDADAKLIFYFAGHGAREKYLDQAVLESFLICHDTDADDLFSSGFRLVELMQLLRILKPTQAFLFIDACSQRLNQIENPLNDKNIFSTTNSKGLFCLFSSGINNSYEDAKTHYGYFTNALLKAFGELRLNKQANCYDIVKRVAANLKDQALPPPEVYHIGLENIWPLENFYENPDFITTKDHNEMVLRWEALGQIQDSLVTSSDPVIWIWGEGGMGKTVIAEQVCKTTASAIYASIPLGTNDWTYINQTVIDQIRTQKGELFFNRPPETSLYQIANYIASQHPGTILILDHFDRLGSNELATIIADIEKISLPCLIISRYPCPLNFFKTRKSKIIEWLTISLSLEEIEQLVVKSGLDSTIASVLLNASKGNALKVRQMLVKLLGQEIPVSGNRAKEFINSMKALAACGGFIDEHLFCKTFGLKFNTLSTLEKLGLVRYTSNGCFPHDFLMEMVEENQWPLDIYKACNYWKRQIQYMPYNRWACRSLIILASQLENCKAFKKSLSQCMETLNERENLSFLIDLIRIFQKHKWEELLLKASDYLIDHEEYKLAGEVLLPLLTSPSPAIKSHACKNDARRLVWLGNFGESIRSNIDILKKCRSPQVFIPLKNNIGIAHFFSGNLDHALELFQENIGYKGKKDEREIGIAKLMIGLIMTYRGENVSKAKELLESSLQIFETTKFYLWNIVGLNSLGDLSYRLEQWRQALYYLEKATTIAEALQNKTFHLFTLKNAVRVYLRLLGIGNQELSIAVENLEMVLKQVLETGHNWVTVWAENVLATIYAHRKEINKLQTIMNDVVPLTQNYKECHIFTLSNLGHLAALKQDYENAKKSYNEAFMLTRELNNPFALHEIQQDFLGCGLPRFLLPKGF